MYNCFDNKLLVINNYGIFFMHKTQLTLTFPLSAMPQSTYPEKRIKKKKQQAVHKPAQELVLCTFSYWENVIPI